MFIVVICGWCYSENRSLWEYWGSSLIKFDSRVSLVFLKDISITALQVSVRVRVPRQPCIPVTMGASVRWVTATKGWLIVTLLGRSSFDVGVQESFQDERLIVHSATINTSCSRYYERSGRCKYIPVCMMCKMRSINRPSEWRLESTYDRLMLRAISSQY